MVNITDNTDKLEWENNYPTHSFVIEFYFLQITHIGFSRKVT